jgi:hypothetical protein
MRVPPGCDVAEIPEDYAAWSSTCDGICAANHTIEELYYVHHLGPNATLLCSHLVCKPCLSLHILKQGRYLSLRGCTMTGTPAEFVDRNLPPDPFGRMNAMEDDCLA